MFIINVLKTWKFTKYFELPDPVNSATGFANYNFLNSERNALQKQLFVKLSIKF